MEVSIRPYQESDLERIIAIWLEGWASSLLPFIPVRKRINSRITPERLRTSIPEKAKNGERLIYVACFQNDVVAFIIFWENNLDQLFVDARFRRKGIGKKLVEFAKAIRPQGFWLHTAAASRDANSFYLGVGLQHTAVELHPELELELAKYEWRPK